VKRDLLGSQLTYIVTDHLPAYLTLSTCYIFALAVQSDMGQPIYLILGVGWNAENSFGVNQSTACRKKTLIACSSYRTLLDFAVR
jgi:hypothetical protein